MKRLVSALVTLLVLSLAVAPSVAAANFPARIDLPNGFQPEGITSGPGTTFYAGSIATGAIWKGDVRTGSGDYLVQSADGPALGVEFEASAGRLWVAGGPSGQVRVYDAGSGELLGSWQFSAGFLNDVVATPDAIYVTDSVIPQLIVIPLGPGGSLPGSGGGTTVPLSGDIAYQAGFNANGIVSVRGQLIIVQSNTGKLFTVSPEGATSEIDLGGDNVINGDGLEALGSALFVVQNANNQIAVVRLEAGLESGQVANTLTNDGLDFPTTVAYAAGHLWVVNARFTTPPTPDTPYWVTRIP
jgi:hypothetical protein